MADPVRCNATTMGACETLKLIRRAVNNCARGRSRVFREDLYGETIDRIWTRLQQNPGLEIANVAAYARTTAFDAVRDMSKRESEHEIVSMQLVVQLGARALDFGDGVHRSGVPVSTPLELEEDTIAREAEADRSAKKEAKSAAAAAAVKRTKGDAVAAAAIVGCSVRHLRRLLEKKSDTPRKRPGRPKKKADREG